jgi:hypothetical protein
MNEWMNFRMNEWQKQEIEQKEIHTKKFDVLRSRWTIFLRANQYIPNAISWAILIFLKKLRSIQILKKEKFTLESYSYCANESLFFLM